MPRAAGAWSQRRSTDGIAPARGLPAALALAAVLLASTAAPVAAASPPGPAASAGGIYTCIDERGRRLTADRPIPECAAREQQVLNRDGSLRRIHPPTLTPEELAEQEARERRLAAQRAAQADAVRRDRNLLARFADEAAHRRAREAALTPVQVALRVSENRLRELAAERQPLDNESEFYVGRALPPRLRAQLDANDAAVAAQRDSQAQLGAELARVNRLYDIELERLRRLWAGATPGSLGPLPAAQGALTAAGTR
jgi:hypothetical protein